MKKLMAFILIGMSFQVFAAKTYVGGAKAVTFRSGPGNDYKILKMIDIDSPVTIVEESGEWTKVKDSEETEGYILTRFLNKETPVLLKYNWLRSEHKKLQEKLSNLKQLQDEVSMKLSSTKKELEVSKEEFQNTKTAFDDLKSGSQQYLALKAAHKESTLLIKEQKLQISKMEDLQLQRYMYFFLAGAGVLLIGWIFGLVTRKKNQYGNSIQL